MRCAAVPSSSVFIWLGQPKAIGHPNEWNDMTWTGALYTRIQDEHTTDEIKWENRERKKEKWTYDQWWTDTERIIACCEQRLFITDLFVVLNVTTNNKVLNHDIICFVIYLIRKLQQSELLRKMFRGGDMQFVTGWIRKYCGNRIGLQLVNHRLNSLGHLLFASCNEMEFWMIINASLWT